LKKQPAPLGSALWKKLREYGLIETPEERRENSFCHAPDSDKEATAYSNGVRRALKGVLALDRETAKLEIVFKAGTDAGMNLLVHDSTSRLLINDKWLEFHTSHESSDCDLALEASHQHLNIDTFDCGHIIVELYDYLVAELSRKQQKIPAYPLKPALCSAVKLPEKFYKLRLGLVLLLA
jgi:hypothetical protein